MKLFLIFLVFAMVAQTDLISLVSSMQVEILMEILKISSMNFISFFPALQNSRIIPMREQNLVVFVETFSVFHLIIKIRLKITACASNLVRHADLTKTFTNWTEGLKSQENC